MGFRVRVRVGIRSRVRARCGFGFICFSSSKLELNICLCGKKQVTGLNSLTLPKWVKNDLKQLRMTKNDLE